MFEAYSVSIRLSLINGVTGGLLSLASQFKHVHGNAVALQAQLARIKGTLLAGGALAATGLFGLSLLDKPIKAAKEYAHQLAQMNVQHMTTLEIARAQRAAWGIARVVPTSDAAENLASIREMRQVFGNTDVAIRNLATIQKLQALLANTGGESGHDQAYNLAKALELKGAVRNPSQFNVQADAMAKAIIASGGKVTGTDFLSAFKYGRTATAGWSDEFVYTVLPTLIQEMKGGGGSSTGGPGTALMSAYAAIVGGTMSKKSILEWQKLGLVDMSKVVSSGSGWSLGQGAIRGWQQMTSNPFKFAQEVLGPALKAHGITKDEDVRGTLQHLLSSRTAGFVMAQLVMQGWKFQRDQKLISSAQGLGGYKTLMSKDPLMIDLALQKQWHNVLILLGIQILPPLIKVTLMLVHVLQDLNYEMRRHPTIVRVLTTAFVGLMSALTIGGLALLLNAVTSALGLLAASLGIAFLAPWIGLGALAAGLGVAIVALYQNWSKIQGPLLSYWEKFAVTVGHAVDNTLGLNSTQGSFYVPSGGGARGAHAGNVYLDGRKVGAHIAHAMGRSGGAVQNGSTTFDASQSPFMPGYNGP